MIYEIQVLKMGECQVPGPEVYWMSNWDTWETLHFWMVVIRGGGWLSGALIKRGWSINRARKTVMFASAVLIVPIMFASTVPQWWAVALIGLATAAHQAWSANLFTTVSDMFPNKAIGSIVGLGGMAGSIGGVLIAAAVGFILQLTGSYLIVFVIAGSAYLLALAVFAFLVPRIDTVAMA